MLWSRFAVAEGRGLEIGPLHNVAVPRDRADVQYLDVYDRAGLIDHYAGDAAVPAELIPEIDHVLFDGTRVRSIPETVGPDLRFDWVLASHVIEHVPDVIGWLDQIASITVDGGALMLVVPDRRYCFDAHRPGTSVGQLLEAHELGAVAPSVRAVFDHHRSAVRVRPQDLWAGRPVTYDKRVHDLDYALDRTAAARAGEYVDCHVWLFTPNSLLEQLVELRTLGLSQWVVDTISPTSPDHLEFFVQLRRLPRSGWGPDDVSGEPRPGDMPDWLAADKATVERLAAAERRLAETERRLTTTQAELAALRRAASRTTTARVKRRARRLPGYALAQRAVRRRRR